MRARFVLGRWGILLALLAAVPVHATELELRLHGSNTIGQRLAPALVEEFAASRGMGVQPQPLRAADERLLRLEGDGSGIAAAIFAHGTGTGFASLVDGKADLWMASRPVAAAELAQSAAIGRLDTAAQEHVIALDGLSIIVHPSNPLAGLTLDQVREVFAGRIRDWSALGAPAGPIAVYARDDKSGTYDTFRTLVLGASPLTDSARRFESTDELASAVATDRRGIGFVGVAGVGAARALALSDTGTRPLRPGRLTVATEDYVLSRRLFLYNRADASPLAREFVEFVLGARGQGVVERIGFVSQDVVALDVPPRTDVSPEYVDLTRGARRLSVNFRFGSGATLLDTKALRDVDRVAAFLRGTGRQDLLLIGFADGNESNPYQALSLSNDRVDYVAQQLVDRGVGPRRVRGMGHAAPVASDVTEQGRAKNRRVEVWVRDREPGAAASSPAG